MAIDRFDDASDATDESLATWQSLVEELADGATAAVQTVPCHRVVVVDDQSAIRQLIRVRLGFERDMDVVGEASNGYDAVSMVKAVRPNVVILDMEMPLMRGDDAIPLIRAAVPGIGILLYTASTDRRLAAAARADVVVEKSARLADMVQAIRQVSAASSRDYREEQPQRARRLS